MAIVNENLAECEFLVGKCPELVRGRATGAFFCKPTEAEALDTHTVKAYYGELPLSFAVATNQPEMVRFLISKGAFIDDRDVNGNTAAHIAVFYGRIEMYELLDELWQKKFGHSDDVQPTEARGDMSLLTNVDGFTPLSLAASMHKEKVEEGSKEEEEEGGKSAEAAAAAEKKPGGNSVFLRLWLSKRKTMWTWGAISASLYPLDVVDSVGALLKQQQQQQPAAAKGKSTAPPPPSSQSWGEWAWNSFVSHHKEAPNAMSAAVDNENKELLSSYHMRGLIEKKWLKFGQVRFSRELNRTLLFALIFAAWVIARTEMHALDVASSSPSFLPMPWTCGASTAEVSFGLCASSRTLEIIMFAYAVFGCIDHLRRLLRLGAARYFDMSGAGWLNRLPAAVACVLILLAFVMRGTGFNPVFTFDPSPDAASLFNVSWGSSAHASQPVANGECVGDASTCAAGGGAAAEAGAAAASTHENEEYATYELGNVLLAIASVSTYSHLASFLLAFRNFGPFVIMVTNMLRNDIQRFLLVMVIFIVGFSQFFFLLEHSKGFDGFLDRLRKSFVGALDASIPDSRDLLVVFPAVIFTFLATLTLLSILSAMLNDTYSDIRGGAEAQYWLELARIVLNIEQTMTVAERMDPKAMYWIMDKNNRPCFYIEKSDEAKLGSNDRKERIERAMKEVRESDDAVTAAAKANRRTSPRISPSARRVAATAAAAAAEVTSADSGASSVGFTAKKGGKNGKKA